MTFQRVRVKGRGDERGANGDGEDGNDIYEYEKRVEISWPLVCR